MSIDELRKMQFTLYNMLSTFEDCLSDDTNIHRVFLAKKRVLAVHLVKEEKNCAVVSDTTRKEFGLKE